MGVIDLLLEQQNTRRRLQIRPIPKSKFLGIVVAELLQAGCPYYRPINSIEALKACDVAHFCGVS